MNPELSQPRTTYHPHNLMLVRLVEPSVLRSPSHSPNQYLNLLIFLFSLIILLGGGQAAIAHQEQPSPIRSSNPEQPALNIDPTIAKHSLTPEFYWLRDVSHSLDLGRVMQAETLAQFEKQTDHNFNLGYSNDPIWIYIPLQEMSKEHPDTLFKDPWLLQIPYPLLDLLEVYIRSPSGEVHSVSLGDNFPYDHRAYKDPAFYVPLPLQQEQLTELYIRAKSTSSLQLSMNLISLPEATREMAAKNTAYGIYFGLMLVIVFYNLFIYWSVRDKSYIYYVLHVASFGLLQAAISGHTFAYLWPEATHWSQISLPILIFLAGGLSVQFSRHFLAVNTFSPRLDRLLLSVMLLCFVAIPACFWLPVGIMTSFAIFLTLFSASVVLLTAKVSFDQGHRTAHYFILACSCLIIGAAIHGMAALSWIPANFFTLRAGIIGSSLEVVLISLALTGKINSLTRENQRISENARNQLQAANQELNEAIDKLEESSQIKDQFLATISHELRTPMNGVEGSLSLIDSKRLSKKQQNYFESAKRSAKHMTGLIDSMLYFSEMQSSGLALNPHNFEIRCALNPLAINFRQLCHQKNLCFNWHIDKNIPMTVKCDSELLSQLLKQVIDNAIKFTQQGSITVNITYGWDEHSKQEMLSCSVIDSGYGIPEEELSNIFSPFRQLDANDNRQQGGLGIGLAISHKIAELMGGRLQVQSELGLGTEFTLILPLQPVDDAVIIQHDDSAEFQQRKTVLVAEDNPVNQMVLTTMLQRLGCIILTASNGDDVTGLLESHPVDLILMDCQMPVVDGFEATRRIRNSQTAYSNVPIIAVTANAMTGDNLRCLNAGMNDYIKKPVSPEIVERKVKHWLQVGKLAAI